VTAHRPLSCSLVFISALLGLGLFRIYGLNDSIADENAKQRRKERKEAMWEVEEVQFRRR